MLYCDEAMTCIMNDGHLRPATLFSVESERDSVISGMWYYQLVEASNGFQGLPTIHLAIYASTESKMLDELFDLQVLNISKAYLFE